MKRWDNGYVYYQDCNSYFYFVYKIDLPNKKKKEEYKKFKDSNEAVYVQMYKNDYQSYLKWFSSQEELMKEYDEIKRNTPVSYSQPFFNIKRQGYKMHPPPEDRKTVFRLPYFRLDKELEYGLHEHSNEKSINHWIVRKWCGMLEGYKQFGEAFNNMDLIEDLITRWCEYKKGTKYSE